MIIQYRNNEAETQQELRLTLDSTRRESEWKPSNSLAKNKSSALLNTISLSNFVLYQFFGLAGRDVRTDT